MPKVIGNKGKHVLPTIEGSVTRSEMMMGCTKSSLNQVSGDTSMMMKTANYSLRHHVRAASTIEKKGNSMEVSFKDYITTFAKEDEFS